MVGSDNAAVVVHRKSAWRKREWSVFCAGERVVRAACLSGRDGKPLLVWLGTDETLTDAVLGAGDSSAAAFGTAGSALALAQRLTKAAQSPVWLLSGPPLPLHLRPAVQKQLFSQLFEDGKASDTELSEHV